MRTLILVVLFLTCYSLLYLIWKNGMKDYAKQSPAFKDNVIRVVCEVFKTKPAEIASSTKLRNVVDARRVFIYHLNAKYKNISRISREIGKSRSVITYHIEQYDILKQSDKNFKSKAAKVEELLREKA